MCDLGKILIRTRAIISFLFWFSTIIFCVGRETNRDTTKDKIDVIHAEFLNFERTKESEIQYLRQDVVIKHKNTYLFCDSAIITGLKVRSIGHVRIVEGDSLQIFGDTLNYDGSVLKAELINNVILNHHQKQVFTDRIFYDLKKRIASYINGGLLISDNTVMQSKKAYYYAKSEQAFFKDSVNVILNDSMNIQSDTIQFDSKQNKVIFLAPTHILKDSLRIFCESGHYDITNRISYFEKYPTYNNVNEYAEASVIKSDDIQKTTTLIKDALIRDSLSEARGDTIIINNLSNTIQILGRGFYTDKERTISGKKIFYHRKDKSLQVVGQTQLFEGNQHITASRIEYKGKDDIGYAYGEVVVRDTQSGWEIHCDTFSYNKVLKKFIPYGRKKFISTPMDNDTLFLTADEIISEQGINNKDTFQVLIANKNVRMWSRKIQGLCDSLYYHGRDSSFTMYEAPVMWSDTTQFSGDTIQMYMRNKALDKINLLHKAFILTEPVTLLYNQIKGREVFAYFKDKKINYTDIFGNAESIYFVQDDQQAYVGMNYIQCSQMKIDFDTLEKINVIHFYNKPDGKLIPVNEGKSKRLDGFLSRSLEKPKSFDDLFLEGDE